MVGGYNLGEEGVDLRRCAPRVWEKLIFCRIATITIMTNPGLPNEILHGIFGLLRPRELAMAGAVCWSWRGPARDRRLWNRFFRRDDRGNLSIDKPWTWSVVRYKVASWLTVRELVGYLTRTGEIQKSHKLFNNARTVERSRQFPRESWWEVDRMSDRLVFEEFPHGEILVKEGCSMFSISANLGDGKTVTKRFMYRWGDNMINYLALFTGSYEPKSYYMIHPQGDCYLIDRLDRLSTWVDPGSAIFIAKGRHGYVVRRIRSPPSDVIIWSGFGEMIKKIDTVFGSWFIEWRWG
jgi:F-box-like